jgi:hypothetical protein
MQNINDFFARKLKTSKSYVHKHGAWIKNTPRLFSHPRQTNCNNEKNDPNNKKLNQNAKAKKNLTQQDKEIITKVTTLLFLN